MNAERSAALTALPAPAEFGGPNPIPSIPQLVAEVYEAAPDRERGRLLEQLLRPLGVLSLFGIAGGAFASIRFRAGWQQLHVGLEDLCNIHPAQVALLVEHAQQVSVETVDGLADWLVNSEAIARSAAASLLWALLVQRARARTAGRAAGHARPRRAV